MNVRLFVLGLLSHAPMHGYQIRKALEESRASVWAEVLPGSIYHALNTLEREGFVALQDVQATGERTRAVYKINAAGRQHLRQLAEEVWDGAPNPYPSRLYAALAFSEVLEPAVLLRRIEAARSRLDEELVAWDRALDAKAPVLSAVLQLAFANARAHLALDRELLSAVAALKPGQRSASGRKKRQAKKKQLHGHPQTQPTNPA